MLLVYHLGGEARKDAEAEPCYSTDSVEIRANTTKCKSWTYVRYVMDRYVEKDVAAAPKEGALKGTKQERKMVFYFFIFTFTQVHPAFFLWESHTTQLSILTCPCLSPSPRGFER